MIDIQTPLHVGDRVRSLAGDRLGHVARVYDDGSACIHWDGDAPQPWDYGNPQPGDPGHEHLQRQQVTIDNSDMPGSEVDAWQTVAMAIGRRKAFRFFGLVAQWKRKSHYGMVGRVYVPKKPNQKMIDALGADDAEKVASVIGGEELPVAPAAEIYKRFRGADIRRQGEEMASGGEKGITKKLAILFDMTEQNIRLILKK